MENSLKTIGNSMRHAYGKFAFTLAEILIVLTIIGVLAVMTIPSLIQNANSQHKIAMFKKAFNAVSNAYATEFAVKTPPSSHTSNDWHSVRLSLTKQLNIKHFEKGGQKVFSDPGDGYWMTTEDGMAINALYCNSNEVSPKLTITNEKSTSKACEKTAFEIRVNIDGLHKGFDTVCADDTDLNKINCDTISFFVTKDGITAGNPDCTIAGRIMSDNITYDKSKCET